MRKWMVLCIAVILCFWTMTTKAATGDIEIQLPDEVKCQISYIKVADMENGIWELEDAYRESKVDLNGIERAEELQEAAEKLLEYIEVRQISLKEETGEKVLLLKDLEEGAYLIVSQESSEAKMLPTIVSLPGWVGEEQTYQVTVVPKFVEKQSVPKTGWESGEGIYIVLFAICSIVIIKLWHDKQHYYSK